MANMSTDSNECSVKIRERKDPTVGEHLDERIAYFRKQVEEACILKAKAEAINMLDKPMSFMQAINGFPF